jgi:hypothetical protein
MPYICVFCNNYIGNDPVACDSCGSSGFLQERNAKGVCCHCKGTWIAHNGDLCIDGSGRLFQEVETPTQIQPPFWVECIDNTSYEDELVIGKTYQVTGIYMWDEEERYELANTNRAARWRSFRFKVVTDTVVVPEPPPVVVKQEPAFDFDLYNGLK